MELGLSLSKEIFCLFLLYEGQQRVSRQFLTTQLEISTKGKKIIINYVQKDNVV